MTRILGVWLLAVSGLASIRAADGFDGGPGAASEGYGEAALGPGGAATPGRPGSVFRGIRPVSYVAPAWLASESRTDDGPPPAPAAPAWYPPMHSEPGCGAEGDCPEPHGPWCFPRRPCHINPQYEPEWYVAGSLGFHEPDDWTVNTVGATMQVEPDGGLQGAAAFGWASGLGYLGRRRMEVELAVRSSDIDDLSLGGLNFQFDGQATVYSGMVNLLWDFKRKDCDWYPYAGFGVGVAEITFEHDLPNFTSDEFHDKVFAWQLMGGVAWRARAWMELFADLRYFSTSTPEFDVSTNAAIATPGTGVLLPAGRQPLRGEYHTFGSMVGVRILLGKRRCVSDTNWDGRPMSGGGFRFNPY